MHPHTTVFAIVTFLHDLFTALWIGGLVAFTFSFLPATRTVIGKKPETIQLVALAQKRQSVIVYVSMVGLAVTGFLLGKRNPDFRGLFSFETTYSALLSIKHVLMIVVVGLALYNSLVIHGERRRFKPQHKRNLSTAILYINIAGGIIILLLSSILAVSSAVP